MKQIKYVNDFWADDMYWHDDVGSLRSLYRYVKTFPYYRICVLRLIEGTFNARRLSCISSNEYLDERFAKNKSFVQKFNNEELYINNVTFEDEI